MIAVEATVLEQYYMIADSQQGETNLTNKSSVRTDMLFLWQANMKDFCLGYGLA